VTPATVKQSVVRHRVAGRSTVGTQAADSAATSPAVASPAAALPAAARPLVRHQAGTRHLAALQANYAAAGVPGECVAFIDDMAAALGEADCVICRAGALTVAELAAGLAALPGPMQGMARQAAQKIAQETDGAKLKEGLAQLEAQAAQVPPQMAPVMDYLKKKMQERIGQLEGGK
jgi:UDP-N-acetylglucosamine--N-acetylmuramyl-(pentapeptide) pyrophosphoryl-undecaprenol N-acetylglucosamine transferase